MKKALIGILILAVVALGAIRPRATAELCGNVTVTAKGLELAIVRTQQEGCLEAVIEPLDDGWYLVYGVKVVR